MSARIPAIPASKRATALRMHYSGSSAREVYVALWPGGQGAPMRLDAFTAALHALADETVNEVRRMALDPESTPEEFDAMTASDPEERLPSDLIPALTDLRAARRFLVEELKRSTEEPLADPDERGKATETVSSRVLSTAKVADSLALNFRAELDAHKFRLERHLKLARPADLPQEENPPPRSASGFSLEMSSAAAKPS